MIVTLASGLKFELTIEAAEELYMLLQQAIASHYVQEHAAILFDEQQAELALKKLLE